MPYGFIRVRKGCVATSNKVTLAGSYEHGSSHKIHNDALDMLKNYNFSNLKIWEPFKVKMPNWLVGCFGLNGPLRQYFSLYRAVSQREGERKEKG